MKDRKIYKTLIKNYVIFVLLMIGILLLSLFYTGIEMSRNMKNELLPKITAEAVVKEDFNSIEASDILTAKGWVEILDESYKVVKVIGEKRTPEMQYTSYELTNLLGIYEKQHFMYTAKSFTTREGKHYTCLAALPPEVADITLNLKNSPFPVSKEFIRTILKGLGIFLFLFLLNIYLYSRWTAKKISVPLDRITATIKEMSQGNYRIRMDFMAENEFLKIRDAYNYMVDKLQEAEKAKEKMEESRQRMFVDISHDLKTPITTICGYSKALAEGLVEDEEKKARYMRTIYEKSQRVTDLINDLFEMAKLENPQLLFNKEKLDFAEFIRGLIAEHYEQMEDKGMELQMEVPDSPVYLEFDKKETGRAVSNIVNNAILYNASGTTIAVRLQVKESTISLTIADNGIGISEELKETIFDPFVRGDNTRNSEGGTGLGLAIAQKIIEGQGGRLALEVHKRGFKTIFKIVIPAAAVKGF